MWTPVKALTLHHNVQCSRSWNTCRDVLGLKAHWRIRHSLHLKGFSNMNYLAYYKVWILTKHIEMVIKLVRFLPIPDNLVASESICKKTLQHSWYLYSFFPLWILQWIVKVNFQIWIFFEVRILKTFPHIAQLHGVSFFLFFFYMAFLKLDFLMCGRVEIWVKAFQHLTNLQHFYSLCGLPWWLIR